MITVPALIEIYLRFSALLTAVKMGCSQRLVPQYLFIFPFLLCQDSVIYLPTCKITYCNGYEIFIKFTIKRNI